MNADRQPSAPDNSAAPSDCRLDEGRKYWKAAIAHLAPEKREAAWEFYLDRLESSAAADTLGGVMLLLEAHLAFFDDLPARLGHAAQQVEAAHRVPSQQVGGSPTSPAIVGLASAAALRRRWRTFLFAGVCAASSGISVYAALLISQRSAPLAPANTPTIAVTLPLTRSSSIRVEPWNDPTTQRPQGVVVSFVGVAWTERTASGGANVYVLSPVEEVRRDLEALRQTSE